MTVVRDRRATLVAQMAFNGIDFIEVANAAETMLRVHFINATPNAAALAAKVTGVTITGGETIPTVAATLGPWGADTAGRPVLQVMVAAPGDFSTYRLALQTSTPVLDPYYDDVAFSFKAGCPSTLDCAPLPPPTPVPPPAPPIDYLAKDFDSFRRALLDFSAQRYPAWQERSEADFGVMFAEALASVADDLSYQQDRIAAEAWIDTATERRSMVRLARLVDYEPRVATAASTLLRFQMTSPGAIPPGVLVTALAPDGAVVEFETGRGLGDTTSVEVSNAWNAMPAYWFDEGERVVATGATTMYVVRPAQALVFDAADPLALLVEVAPSIPSDPPLRAVVHLLVEPVPVVDLLYGVQLYQLTWAATEALPFAVDLSATTVGGNLVRATHGRRHSEQFVTTTEWSAEARFGLPRAVVRTGANATPQFLYTLRHAPLAWLARQAPNSPAPELAVDEAATGTWAFQRLMLEATQFEQVVTVDPMRYRTIDGDRGVAEYDGSAGDTLRFGDGALGALPPDGATFTVAYRAGGGTRGNVAADALTRIAPVTRAAFAIAGVSNPLAATGGADEESAAQIRALAPQAFRAVQYRAVRAEDYELAARTLPWVQRAGTQFRWTGSWLTVFTAVDPRGTETLPAALADQLTDLLDRYRLAGYESYVKPPRYASLDLGVTICADAGAFRADVKRAALDALVAFFQPDRFTFGVPLERSAIEAALQEVPGVDGVVKLRYRRRGYTPGYVEMADTVEVAADEIVRVDNDSSRPDAGSLRVDVRGGK